MDNLTMIRGKHTYKAGLYLNLDDKQQQPSWNDAGNFDFTTSTTKINPNDTNNGLANLRAPMSSVRLFHTFQLSWRQNSTPVNRVEWYAVNTSTSASNPGQAVTQGSRGTSGQVTSARDPRNVQLSMKLYW